MSLLKFSQNQLTHPIGQWVEPEVSKLMITSPSWPITLFANDGHTPVTFNTPAELRAATLPENGQIELFAKSENYYGER